MKHVISLNQVFPTDLKKNWIELLIAKKNLATAILLGPPWEPIVYVFGGENLLDAARERHVIPLNSEEGAFFSKVILPMAYSNPYRESGLNKMAPLASILWEQEQ